MPSCAVKRRRGRDNRDGVIENGNQNQPARSLCHHMLKYPNRNRRNRRIVAEERGQIYRRSKVLLNRPKNPLRADASLPAELVESLREDSGRDDVQLPAPPRPTCHTAPSFIFLSRVF